MPALTALSQIMELSGFYQLANLLEMSLTDQCRIPELGKSSLSQELSFTQRKEETQRAEWDPNQTKTGTGTSGLTVEGSAFPRVVIWAGGASTPGSLWKYNYKNSGVPHKPARSEPKSEDWGCIQHEKQDSFFLECWAPVTWSVLNHHLLNKSTNSTFIV